MHPDRPDALISRVLSTKTLYAPGETRSIVISSPRDRSSVVGRRCLLQLIYFSAQDRAWPGSVARHCRKRKEKKRVGPEGALDFHYAKPQMESCDRVSLCAAPGGAQSRWNKAPKV